MCSFLVVSYYLMIQFQCLYGFNKPPFFCPHSSTWNHLQLARFPSSLELGSLDLDLAGQSWSSWAILISLGNLDLGGQSCRQGRTHKASTTTKLWQLQNFVNYNYKASSFHKMDKIVYCRRSPVHLKVEVCDSMQSYVPRRIILVSEPSTFMID